MIYLDHAATSFPKAPGVAEEAARFLQEDAGNAGRGSHRLAMRAAEGLDRARLGLARLLGIGDAARLALMSGTTEALNVALRGVLREGDGVLVGPEAHNSVLRPLSLLVEQRRVVMDEVRTDDVLRWDLDDLERILARARTALVCVSHGSNVTGAVQDLAEITRLAHAHGARVLVDAAQTVGAVPLEVEPLGLDLVAFSGHKALLGPTGTGGLYVRSGLDVAPLITGGTGSRSEVERPPTKLPGALEAGTANAFAFSALAVGVAWVRTRTPAAIHESTAELGRQLRAGLSGLPGVALFSGDRAEDLPVISFRVEGWDPQELGMALDSSAEVALRAGLHCAPRAHRRLGTLEGGTLRASVGPFLNERDVESTVQAVAGFLH